MSSLDYFAFDEDIDDELLEHHHHHPGHVHGQRSLAASTSSSTSARDLLSRMQLAQVMQQQQQQEHQLQRHHRRHHRHHHHHQQHAVAAEPPAGPLMSNNLVDGLMNDDWNASGGGELFEFDDGTMMEDAASIMGGDVGSPDHAVVGAPLPMLPPSSSSSSQQPAPHMAPTMDDIVAAYWHGRATGAMASAGAAAAAAGTVPIAVGGRGAAAAAGAPSLAHHHHHRRRHPFAAEERAAYPPLPGMSRSSASALTANLATANALATSEALNAQLFQHWLHGDGGAANGGGAGATSAWDNPAQSASLDAFPSYPPLPAFSSPSPLNGNAASTAASASSATASHYLAQLLASGHEESVTASASSSAGAAAASLRDRIRDANTASSLLESRLELARANAFANTQYRSAAAGANGHAATAQAGIGGDDPAGGGGSALLSSLMDFEDASLPGGDDDSIGTVDDPCDTDEEDGDNGEQEDIAATEAEGGGAGGMADPPSCMPPAPAAAISSHTRANDSTTAASGDSPANDNSATAGGEENFAAAAGEDSIAAPAAAATAATPSVPPPRRSRRQAAVRGLERISTALATHGMGGGSSDDEGGSSGHRHPHLSAGGSKKDAASSKSGGKASRKKAPTIIPKPSNKSLEKEKEQQPKPTCCICLEEPTHDELAEINGCSHPFCFTCIEKWADQENTCPLCKARFFKIERANKPKKRKAGAVDGEGVTGGDGGGVRTSKRVRNRDQRSEIPSFVNPLEGIFASMESNGTWPTHIAQLLFSGLGASSLGPGGAARHARSAAAGAQRRSVASSIFPSIPDTSAFAAAAAARRQQQQQRHHPASMMGFRYQPPAGGGSRTTPTSVGVGAGSLLGHQVARTGGQGSQRYGGASLSAASGGNEGVSLTSTSSSLGAIPFAPSPTHARPCPRRRITSTRMATSATGGANNPHYAHSPWSTSASVNVTLGPRGFAGRRSSTASSASTSTFQTFPNPSHVGGSRVTSSSTNGVSAATGGGGNSPFLSGEEEEELLSTLSPSSYIRRLHRELEGGTAATAPRHDRFSAGQYQFNAFPSLPSGRTAPARRNTVRTAAPLEAPSPTDNPFSMFSAAPLPTAALPFQGPSRSHRNRNEWNGHTIRPSGGNHPATARNATAAVSGAAGRSLETALEIDSDDDDDDVVEVIDVEALI